MEPDTNIGRSLEAYDLENLLHTVCLAHVLNPYGAILRSCEIDGLNFEVQHVGLAKQATRNVVSKSMVKFS